MLYALPAEAAELLVGSRDMEDDCELAATPAARTVLEAPLLAAEGLMSISECMQDTAGVGTGIPK